MKNLINAGTNISTVVLPNGILPITTIVKRFNRVNATNEVNAIGNAIAIETKNCNKPRYNIFATITFTAAAAGDVVISAYQDGVEIPLATTSATVTTADTQIITLPITTSIVAKGCGTTLITLINTGTINITVTNVNILAVED